MSNDTTQTAPNLARTIRLLEAVGWQWWVGYRGVYQLALPGEQVNVAEDALPVSRPAPEYWPRGRDLRRLPNLGDADDPQGALWRERIRLHLQKKHDLIVSTYSFKTGGHGVATDLNDVRYRSDEEYPHEAFLQAADAALFALNADKSEEDTAP